MDPTSMEALYAKPGFVIRRAYQISNALFDEAATPLGITATQFSVLHTLRVCPDIDQISLCALIGIDRSTATLVLRLLEGSGLIVRLTHPADRRRKVLNLTDRGRDLLAQSGRLEGTVAEGLREALTDEEADQLLTLLGKFVSTFNERVRNPLRAPQQDQGR